MQVNCRNIESRHIGISLSGCVPARPYANLYLPFFQPKHRAPGSRISYKSENDATQTGQKLLSLAGGQDGPADGPL